MRKWKKFLAAALAFSMSVPSCIPQTLWGAEFSSESQNESAESFGDGENEENSQTGVTVGTNDDNEGITAGGDTGEKESGEVEFGTGELEITDNVPADSSDPIYAGQTADGYVMQLYSNGKLEKTYVIPYTAAETAQAPAALTGRKGYIFKEWNTKEDGKGTSYKPGASIKKLLEENNINAQNQSLDSAESAEGSENQKEIMETPEETEYNGQVEEAAETPEETEYNGQVEEAAETDKTSEQNPQACMDVNADSDVDTGDALSAKAEEDKNNTITLYAIWEKAVSYKITYKLNKGKNNSANPKTYTSEDKITLKNPTRSGYHFAGWYQDSKYKKRITTIEKGSRGAITLYAKWVGQINPSVRAAALTSVRGAKARMIAATARISKYVKSCDDYYYLVYVDSNTGKVKKEAAKIKKPEAENQKLTFRLDISGHPEYAQGKFAVAVKKSKTAWYVISSTSYVSSPEKLSANKAAYFVPKTKKGIQSTDISEVTETKSKTAFINIYASDILSGGYGDAYVYNGKKYYFGGMYGLRYFVQQCNARGIQVTAQISLDKSSATQSLTTGNSPYAETAFYGWNTAKSAPRQKMEAMFAYLGEMFGSNDCYVSNWILGNEINSASHYYYVGNVSFNKYISMYSEAFRCLYNAVRSSRGSSKVFICLDNCWNQKNIFTVCYTSKSTLDTFASAVSGLQKGISWNLAYHAYSQPLTESQFWSSVNAPLLSNDGNTATFITMHNIQALTNYVKNRFGSQTRVILSEQGFSSSFGGQANQAASMALAYYKAACNPMIDAFIIRSYQDEAHEVAQGLALGLKSANGKKKTVYNVFRNMDGSDSLKYTGKVLNSQVGNWKAQVPGYTAKRVSGMYRK